MTKEYHNSNDLYEEFKKYGFTTERVEELKKELKDQFYSTSGVLGMFFKYFGKFLHIKIIDPIRDFSNASPLVKFWSFVVIGCLLLAVWATWQGCQHAWSFL
jgi:hypothetical protein